MVIPCLCWAPLDPLLTEVEAANHVRCTQDCSTYSRAWSLRLSQRGTAMRRRPVLTLACWSLCAQAAHPDRIRLTCRVVVEASGELEERSVRIHPEARVVQDNATTSTKRPPAHWPRTSRGSSPSRAGVPHAATAQTSTRDWWAPSSSICSPEDTPSPPGPWGSSAAAAARRWTRPSGAAEQPLRPASMSHVRCEMNGMEKRMKP